MHILRLILPLFLIGVSGCSAISKVPHAATNELAKHISENASNINEAQARATNAIILRNVLRAKDRWPTQYSTLSGIESQPKMTFNATGEFGPLGLGNPAMPFGESKASVSYDNQSFATYAVNPFINDKVQGDNILSPIPEMAFKAFWDAGWPRDILIMMFVQEIQSADGETSILNNTKNRDEFIKAIAPLLGGKECSDFLKINGHSVGETETESSGDEEDGAKPNGSNNQKPKADSVDGKPKDDTGDETNGTKQELGCRIPSADDDANQIVSAKKILFEMTNEKEEEENCPIIKDFEFGELLTNVDAGENGLLNQIATLKELSGGKVHLNFDSEVEKGAQVRACASFSKSHYEFKLAPSDPKGDTKKKNDPKGDTKKKNRTKKTAIYRVKLRSIDSAIYFAGEWLREFERAGSQLRPYDSNEEETATPGDQENPQPSAKGSIENQMVAQSDQGTTEPSVDDRNESDSVVAGDEDPEESSSGAPQNDGMNDQEASERAIEAPFNVLASAECRDKGKSSASLFNAATKNAIEENARFRRLDYEFAASTDHKGRRYYAGPAPRADCVQDRTTTALSLLAKLFAMSQSADFLKAPSGSTIQAR